MGVRELWRSTRSRARILNGSHLPSTCTTLLILTAKGASPPRPASSPRHLPATQKAPLASGAPTTPSSGPCPGRHLPLDSPGGSTLVPLPPGSHSSCPHILQALVLSGEDDRPSRRRRLEPTSQPAGSPPALPPDQNRSQFRKPRTHSERSSLGFHPSGIILVWKSVPARVRPEQ